MGVSESATKSLNKNPFNNKKPNKSHSITPKEQSKNSTEIHAAAYVSENFIKNNGRLGRSLGCPSLPKKDYDKVVGRGVSVGGGEEPPRFGVGTSAKILPSGDFCKFLAKIQPKVGKRTVLLKV